jgi:DNA (cytosine-5)-methyltransferase 1
MIYGSVCSGIEAASVAWSPLGWQAAWLSEIEKFPNLILAHHYPDIPNLGDMTKIYANQTFKESRIDLLVGGTPCQSFSVAGLRKGLDDPRGNLCLEFLRLVDLKRPRWFVWENVPGVLSSGKGRDFGSFLGAIQKLGYGFAYRVLDAQYFGVPQRRRRVFVVGYLGDWRPASAVLFEHESLLGNPKTSRKTRKNIAPTISARTKGGGGLGTDFDLDGGLIQTFDRQSTGEYGTDTVASTVSARDYKSASDLIAVSFHENQRAEITLSDTMGSLKVGGGKPRQGYPAIAFNHQENHSFRAEEEVTNPLRVSQTEAVCVTGDKTHTLKAEGFDASEDGTGREQPIIAFTCKDSGGDAGEKSPTLRAGEYTKSHANAGVMPAAVFKSQVRRLTPRECERLQGFPDDYTLLPLKKPADGPRYKALGNSMAVPVMRWIGERINQVEDILDSADLF